MRKLYLLLLVLILVNTFVYSQNETITEIEQDFIEVEEILYELKNGSFNTQRVNDTLKAAKQIYEVQILIENENKRDFSVVEQYLEGIFKIRDQAYNARDEIVYVNAFYEETKKENPGMNLSEADLILNEMQFEFENERYEEAYELAKEAYSKIIEIEGQHTALNLAYKATTKTLKSFFLENWLVILIVVGSGTILYFVFRNRIVYLRTKLKIKRLEKEYKVLEEIMKTTQKEYFEKGTMSEATYQIRTKKFSELMRDINRQLPLFREELAKRNKLKAIKEKHEKRRKKVKKKIKKKPKKRKIKSKKKKKKSKKNKQKKKKTKKRKK
jgi:hypothetical protein